MVAKVIVHGENRTDAINKMRRALDEFYVSPIKTTIGLHKKILAHPKFREGHVTTHFLEKYFANKK